ncbi:GntR family transcriptional regulator [Lentibacillus kapialis]|uniref:GntR family transcriptional regulator n=1 Tax=Lentibacillus kapialis TaxID=340214 RepID=A0A917UZU0_9BACI|nr:GntR family transcriptional regulator [Lentibacillus kapialis]GGK02305.1 GntR family transcriptional regulator [Lentibacillus kapialis]
MLQVSRKNPLALYIQLKEVIVGKIDSGEWKEGEMIPTELELQEVHNLSRTTVRQTLTDLVHEGVLERVQGKGTFVANKKLEPIRPGLTGFTQDMENKGYNVQSVILTNELVVPSQKIQRILELSDNQKVLKLDRIRLVDEIVVGMHETYLNIDLTPSIKLENYNFERESLYKSLIKEGVILGNSEETVEANLPNDFYSEILGINFPVPVLEILRTTSLEDGSPYEVSNMIYKSDKYKYTIKLKHL